MRAERIEAIQPPATLRAMRPSIEKAGGNDACWTEQQTHPEASAAGSLLLGNE
jgi:hypothetical protein